MALHAAFNKEKTRLAEADDPEMKRYVEEQLLKRLGKAVPDIHDSGGGLGGNTKGLKRPKTVEELALEAAVPKQKELFSDPGAAFVAGVAEVPLGVEHKLKNIEATEAAKAALLAKGGNAARAKYGSRYNINERDDDDGDGGYYGGGSGGGGTGAFRRGQFPVRFGKMSEKEQGVLADVAAKKAAHKQRAEERKREQQKEFKGFF
jgi:Hepatocellular carcinoma-associated antigen 59